MQPADINGHSLQQQCGALSDRFIPSLSELVEEFLMTVNGTGRTRSPELLLERNGVTQGLILTLVERWIGPQRNNAPLCLGAKSAADSDRSRSCQSIFIVAAGVGSVYVDLLPLFHGIEDRTDPVVWRIWLNNSSRKQRVCPFSPVP